MDCTSEATFRCPGEPYHISAAQHWARLERHYHKCADCQHRWEQSGLPQKTLHRFAREEQFFHTTTHCTSPESIGGVWLNQFGPLQAQLWASAFGKFLLSDHSQTATVLVANDGRDRSPEMVAAVMDALRSQSCHAVEVGVLSAPALADAVRRRQAQGGVRVGNPLGLTTTVGLRFWTEHGRPLANNQFQTMQAQFSETSQIRPAQRPLRHALERLDVEADYLARFAPHYHALRPLTVALSTDCQSVITALRHLFLQVGCCLTTYLANSPNHLPFRQFVKTSPAQLGMWIDTEGEQCQAFDEHGQAIPTATLTSLLASFFPPAELLASDALWVLTYLLKLLSQSDLPLSAHCRGIA